MSFKDVMATAFACDSIGFRFGSGSMLHYSNYSNSFSTSMYFLYQFIGYVAFCHADSINFSYYYFVMKTI